MKNRAIELLTEFKQENPIPSKIKYGYWFPHKEELRLVIIDEDSSLEKDQIFPYDMEEEGVFVDFIYKEDSQKLPKGWGKWSDAVKVYPKRGKVKKSWVVYGTFNTRKEAREFVKNNKGFKIE